MSILTLSELESHLWESANILRGKIDASDYKHYIFGLLFYKRLCDVWEEEYEEAVKEYNDDEMARDPEEHRFHIPEGYFWKDIRKHSVNIGENLNGAFHAIEDANLKLKDIFQDVDFNNKQRFPDRTLELLLQHYDKLSLRKSEVEADVLGNAYEYLIAKFADDAGKKGGEFYTPKMVVRLIVECIEPEEGMTVYDPTCGSGGMLLESIHHLERKGLNAKSLSLYGQEMNLNTWAICKMNLFLHDIDDAFIERGDTLRDPKHRVKEDSNALKTFDRVIANPPFSLKNWGIEDWKDGDKFGRDTYGCPPKSYGDLAFVQHMYNSLNTGGKMGVVLPHGILFRGGAEGKIRKGLIQDDKIEAVIGIAPNLFYGTGIPACVLIINNNKPKEKQGKVCIINGSELYIEGKNQNSLSDNNIITIKEAYNQNKDIERFCKVVDFEEIMKNDFNLNIARYIQTIEPEESINVKSEMVILKDLLSKSAEAETVMLNNLKELGYDS